MPKERVSLALSRGFLTAPVMDGEIEPEGIDLMPSVVPVNDLFWRQLRFAEFDVSEMSLSQLCILYSRNIDDWVAIPVFPARAFFHLTVLVSQAAGIREPADLAGKRVGVPDYAQTAALWTRGVLQHYYNVAPKEMSWVVGRRPERSHGALTGAGMPPDVIIEYAPPGDDLGQMLLEGRLDAVIAYGSASLSNLALSMDPPKANRLGIGLSTFVDPVRRDIDRDSRIRYLFDHPVAAGQRYYEDTGLLHINHLLVVRRALAERCPWVPRNLYDAFALCRDLAISRLERSLALYSALGAVDVSAVRSANRQFAYGLKANMDVLTAAVQYAREQSIIAAELNPESLFAETTRQL